MIGRYIGTPSKCLICNVPECHNLHSMMCGRIGDIDKLAGEGKWHQALSELQKLFRCTESMVNLCESMEGS
jgi:NADPH-dependent glutamate synthase beta subunit-like oxidoreductase